MIRRLIILLLNVACVYGHEGHHQFLTPYISPGIQIGYNANKTLFLSCQLTIGSGFKVGDHFEDTMPLLFGKTFGLRAYYQDNQPAAVYKYSDNQISFMFGGMGIGKIIDSNGNSFKKNKYWIGALGLLTYEKIFFDEKLRKQYSLSVVFPYPIEMAFVE